MERCTCRLRATTLATSLVLCASTNAASARELPPRFVLTSLGADYNPSLGHASTTPPALLTVAPELQLGWGIVVAKDVLVFTRLDLMGTTVPIGPWGAGLDVGLGWLPGAKTEAWSPALFLSAGGVLYASGGEVLGPDYQARGFRLALEGGAMRHDPFLSGVISWGVLAGAHATVVGGIEPCNVGDDCGDVFIGPSLRAVSTYAF
jgi:hypothetical protein